MSGTHRNFVDGLISAARDNPVAAALIGGGALWLLIGNDKLKNAATPGNARGAAAARSSASDALSGTAGTIRDRLDDGVAAAQETWGSPGRTIPSKRTLRQAQASLTDMFERQPLVLGAVGLAIGATVASALAKSSVENEWIGEFSDNVKADLAARAEAVSQSVREASDTLKAEFADVGVEYADRVKHASRDAMDAAGDKLR